MARFRFGKKFSSALEEYTKKRPGASLDSVDFVISDKNTVKPKRKKIFEKIEEYFTAIAHSARTKRQTARLQNDLRALEKRIDEVRDTLCRLEEIFNKKIDKLEETLDDKIDKLDDKFIEVSETINKIGDKINDEKINHQIITTDLLRNIKNLERACVSNGNSVALKSSNKETGENKFILESFYSLLEDKYRGSRDEILGRLKVYLNEFESAKERTLNNGAIIDLGCGRGEFLELLNSHGFNAIGVDNNPIQLRAAENKNLSVVNDDIFEYILKIPDNSIMAVTVIHVIEHLSFDKLITLCSHIFRILMPGGVAIFETPNPRNLIVGATTFHIDPTHVKPIPSEVCSTLLEVLGYQNISINHLHPSSNYKKYFENREFDHYLTQLLFGPQDYSVTAQKGIIR